MLEKIVRQDLDCRLLAAIAQGNLEAFNTFYDRLSGPLYTLSLRMTGDTVAAEAILQEVFIVIWRNADRYNPVFSSVYSWAVHLTRCMTIAHVRSSGCRLRALDSAGKDSNLSRLRVEPETITQGTPDDTRRPERAVRLCEVFDALPAEQRRVLELAFFNDLSHHEISARLELPLSTVKACIREGLFKLRDGIKEGE